MQLFQLTGLVNKPLNKRQETALAEAMRKALLRKNTASVMASMKSAAKAGTDVRSAMIDAIRNLPN